MGERAIEHVGDDLHVAMRVGGKTGARRDAVVIDDAQRAESHVGAGRNSGRTKSCDGCRASRNRFGRALRPYGFSALSCSGRMRADGARSSLPKSSCRHPQEAIIAYCNTLVPIWIQYGQARCDAGLHQGRRPRRLCRGGPAARAHAVGDQQGGDGAGAAARGAPARSHDAEGSSHRSRARLLRTLRGCPRRDRGDGNPNCRSARRAHRRAASQRADVVRHGLSRRARSPTF